MTPRTREPEPEEGEEQPETETKEAIKDGIKERKTWSLEDVIQYIGGPNPPRLWRLGSIKGDNTEFDVLVGRCRSRVGSEFPCLVFRTPVRDYTVSLRVAYLMLTMYDNAPEDLMRKLIKILNLVQTTRQVGAVEGDVE